MILDANTHTETNCTIQGNSFSIKASPIAFDILSSKLYSNPVLAVVRELLTNAYDSHVAAGNTDKEIDVVFPTALDTEFSIRDYGTGLSKEDVMTLYTTFFDSTKSNSNDFTGGFGLGSKTPFSYTSSFTVTSFFNGTKYVFLATKKDGYPSILPLAEEPTNEPNGLLIRIPVNKDNGTLAGTRFFEEAKDYLIFMPEIKITCNKEFNRPKPFLEWDNIKLYRLSRRHYNYTWQYDQGVFIKQGQNIYKINKYVESNYAYKRATEGILDSVDFIYEVPIGTLAITPSREQLSNDEANKAKIDDIILDIIRKAPKITEYILANIELLKNNNAPNIIFDKYRVMLFNKYFKFSESLREYWFSWNSNNESSIRLGAFSIRSIRLNDSERTDYFNNTAKYYLLYTKNISDQKITRKIRNIIGNYEELQDENVGIRLLDIEDSWNYNEIKDVLSRIRYLKGLIWTLNNAEELKFNIELMPITAFLRKFPNHKAPKKINKSQTIKSTNIHIVDITMPFYSGLKKITTDNDLQNYTVDNSLVIPVDTKAEGSVLSEYSKLKQFFEHIPLYFKDTNNNTFIGNFFLDKLGLSLENMKFPKMYIILTAKGNMHKFKNYKTMNTEELFDLVRNTDFICYQKYDGWWKFKISKFDQWVEDLQEPFKSFVKSTHAYKRHSLISQYGFDVKPLEACKYNYTDYHTEYYLKHIINVDNKKFYPSREVFVNRVIQTNTNLYSIYNYIDKYAFRYGNKLVLHNRHKQALLKYLRGDKYVLL